MRLLWALIQFFFLRAEVFPATINGILRCYQTKGWRVHSRDQSSVRNKVSLPFSLFFHFSLQSTGGIAGPRDSLAALHRLSVPSSSPATAQGHGCYGEHILGRGSCFPPAAESPPSGAAHAAGDATMGFLGQCRERYFLNLIPTCQRSNPVSVGSLGHL